MEQRNLGRSGLQVSAVGLGCNNFGWRCDQAQTVAVVDKALELGVALFDTADICGGGLSEEYLGKALGDRRKGVVVATKFAGPMSGSPRPRDTSRRHVLDAVEASLRRLGTDWIDLYQIHFPDALTPIGETLRALDDLVRQGKVRYVGCSNFAAWQVVEAQWITRTEHLSPLISAQNEYNLLERRIERELVPACTAYGLGILPYFPLASGFLTPHGGARSDRAELQRAPSARELCGNTGSQHAGPGGRVVGEPAPRGQCHRRSDKTGAGGGECSSRRMAPHN